MKKVAIIGHGVVGSGVCKVLLDKKNELYKKSGEEIEVKYILDLRDFPGSPVEVIHDFDIIEKDEEVNIVVETMGGVNPAYEYTKRLLLAGKDVVTSNKELVAQKGAELLKIAKEKGRISRRKNGDYFKIFGVIKTERIIHSDVGSDFPAKEKGNKTGNRTKPEKNKPGPIAIGNFRIHCCEICAIGGDKPAENNKAENSCSDYNSFKPF